MTVVLLSQIAGCGSLPDGQLVVTGRGFDRGGEFCADFALSVPQAGQFLSLATPMSAADLHARFNHLPCWVRGTLWRKTATWQWEIRAGGTARLTAPDGAVTLLGCTRCDDLLPPHESDSKRGP